MYKKTLISAFAGIAMLATACYAGSPVLTVDAAEPAGPAISETAYSIVVNGSELKLDSPARLSGNTMLVPARNIAEALGAVVTYKAADQSVTAVKGDVSVTFRIGSAGAVKNGSPFTLNAAPVKDGSVTMVPVRFFSETFGTVVRWDGPAKRVNIDYESGLLPSVGSYGKLKELMKEADSASFGGGIALREGSAITELSKQADAVPAAAAESASKAQTSDVTSGGADYSTTNVQTEGVDEADVVKTDGEYIYQVNRERVIIARAYPAGEMSLVSTIALGEQKLRPLELYVDGNRLIVIGETYSDTDDAGSNVPAVKQSGTEQKKMIARPPQHTTVKTVIYDISSKESPEAVKEVETEGSYVTSRKIGQDLYVIANRYVNRYHILNETTETDTPVYKDTSVSDGYVKIRYEDIRYFPESVLDSYMLVAGIDTAAPERKANVSVYLGSAQNVYASDRNLYVSVNQNKIVPAIRPGMSNDSGKPPLAKAVLNNEQTSTVYKFLMEQGQVRYTAKGQVPGTVLNQFSMDEHNGYFRIATTTGDAWRTGELTSKNNLYVLDESMKIIGKIEDIAPGERIYSVRFMGGRGYMVTFRKVDPLFVLDLADPANPSILGKLKIPGYSDYLHPYDETHLIGFGKDAVEAVNEWQLEHGVSEPSTSAYYQGMKIAMFDVSDVAHPVELFKTEIGDRGTDSELLRNHKALLFSKEKNLMALPVTVMKVSPEAKRDQGVKAYGQFAFQGAYVYRIDLKDGFTLRGTISHLTEEELLKAGSGWNGGGDRNVERILYIKDMLYTLSPGEIRANELVSLQERNRLVLP